MCGSLRFKTLEWALPQTWDVPCVTRIGLSCEFNTSGMKTFSMPKGEADQLSDLKSVLSGLG